MTRSDAASRTISAGALAFSYRDAGSGLPFVLLHGIGSGAVSFSGQLQGLSAQFRVIAWDAPGYADSTPLTAENPDASDYAAALETWLGALRVGRCHVVGHSLGALMAARFAAEQPERVITLTLAAIAAGHGRLSPSERQLLLARRLDDLAVLGPHGMAAKRAPKLLGPDATPEMRRWVIETMACVNPAGYAQAARMLSTADIEGDLARLSTDFPIQVIVGEADVITPPASCERIATACRAASVQVIPRAGHAVYLEQPQLFNSLLADFAAPVRETRREHRTGYRALAV